MSLILSAGGLEGGLHCLESAIKERKSEQELLRIIECVKNDYLSSRWIDEDYVYDRQGQIVKKVNNKYVPVVYLNIEEEEKNA